MFFIRKFPHFHGFIENYNTLRSDLIEFVKTSLKLLNSHLVEFIKLTLYESNEKRLGCDKVH